MLLLLVQLTWARKHHQTVKTNTVLSSQASDINIDFERVE